MFLKNKEENLMLIFLISSTNIGQIFSFLVLVLFFNLAFYITPYPYHLEAIFE